MCIYGGCGSVLCVYMLVSVVLYNVCLCWWVWFCTMCVYAGGCGSVLCVYAGGCGSVLGVYNIIMVGVALYNVYMLVGVVLY